MWSKGAVVIVKHGDQDWADSIEQTIAIRKASNQEVEELKRENTFLKKRTTDDLIAKIEKAEQDYGYNWTPPKWAKWFFDILALIEYGAAMFVDKFMTIKEWREE